MSAARRLVAQEWFSVSELMGLPGLPGTRKGVLNLIDRERWGDRDALDGACLSRPRVGRGGGLEFHVSLLPEQAKARLLAVTPTRPAEARAAESRESVWARYERLPHGMKAEALRRLQALQLVEQFERAGMRRGRAVEQAAAHASLQARAAGEAAPYSVGTLYDWSRKVAGVDDADRLAYLAPAYFGRTVTADCPPEAWEVFKSDYLRPRRTLEAAFRSTQRVAQAQGWGELPSIKTLQRRLFKEVSRLTVILLREGEDAFRREFPWIERDETTFHAMEAINVDGHLWDVMVDFGDGKPARPMMVMIQDLYSRKVVGWRIARSENSNTVRMAFSDMIRRYGIPRLCFFDNGRAFASKWLTGGTQNRFRFKVREEDQLGLLTQLGVKVHFTTPFHGQAKPIERAFRDLEGEIGTSAAFQGAYVGNNPLNKPHTAGQRAIPINEFEREVALGIIRHNARRGRDAKACKRLGWSFDDAFAASLETALVPMPTPEQLRAAMLCVEGVTVRQNGGGLWVGENRYWGDFLTEIVGSKVAARFDADDLHAGLHVYALTGVYLGFAECLEKVGFANLEEGRERLRLVKGARKTAKLAAEAQGVLNAARLAQLMAGLPEDTDPQPEERAVVRGFFGPGSAALALRQDEDEEAAEAFRASARTLRLVGEDDDPDAY